ncbi:hypothetical protein [Actinotalea solisilvae]|uniref:hypothetical protein n=1 Tax=Actinotalea solisilvae TaxID=2072922 RepID=UPI0018F1FB3E|nr:hypothetical protein [Actinotalea solisilvae]
MGLQLTTFLHRLGSVGAALRPGVAGPVAPGLGGGSAGSGAAAGMHGADLRDLTAERVRGLLPVDDRERFDGLVTGSRDAVVLRRTLAATASVAAVAEVAEALADADASTRRAVREPVRAMARAGRQGDGTTCGSSVLTMLAAHGDPTLALWLAAGVVVRSARPPELADAPDGALRALAEAPREARFASVQRVLKRRTSRGAVLGAPWPARYGTPPWTAARVARLLGVPYGHHPLDDTDRPHLDAALDRVGRAVSLGVPVPLYTGGDSGRGWGTAVPRHVVLALDADGDGLHVWEPGSGAVVVADRAALTSGRPHAALGHWNHLVWVLPPRLPGVTA